MDEVWYEESLFDPAPCGSGARRGQRWVWVDTALYVRRTKTCSNSEGGHSRVLSLPHKSPWNNEKNEWFPDKSVCFLAAAARLIVPCEERQQHLLRPAGLSGYLQRKKRRDQVKKGRINGTHSAAISSMFFKWRSNFLNFKGCIAKQPWWFIWPAKTHSAHIPTWIETALAASCRHSFGNYTRYYIHDIIWGSFRNKWTDKNYLWTADHLTPPLFRYWKGINWLAIHKQTKRNQTSECSMFYSKVRGFIHNKCLIKIRTGKSGHRWTHGRLLFAPAL